MMGGVGPHDARQRLAVADAPIRSRNVSPRAPNQLVFMPICRAGSRNTAGRPPTVWIFAISAETTRTPSSNRRWSSNSGSSSARVAHRVVSRATRVDTDTDPPVLLEAGQIDAGDITSSVAARSSTLILPSTKVLQPRPASPSAAVHPKCEPSHQWVSRVREYRCRSAVGDLAAVHHRQRLHGCASPRKIIAVAQGDVDGLAGSPLPWKKPVVILELQPGRRDRVDDSGGLETVARHQFPADLASGSSSVALLIDRLLDRHVSTEPVPDAPIHGDCTVKVPSAVRARNGLAPARRRLRRGASREPRRGSPPRSVRARQTRQLQDEWKGFRATGGSWASTPSLGLNEIGSAAVAKRRNSRSWWFVAWQAEEDLAEIDTGRDTDEFVPDAADHEPGFDSMSA